MAKYHKQDRQARRFSLRAPDDTTVQSSLQELILAKLSEWIPQLVDQEIEEYLSGCDERGEAKPYRNGSHQERHLSSTLGTFPVVLPRLRTAFDSQIVPAYERSTRELGELLPELYMHGLSTGDFRQALGTLLGRQAPISSASILRLKEQWENEYRQWRERPLESDYLYLWADGLYPKAGPKDEKMAVLVVVGLTSTGTKEILAIEEGYRESFESWRDLLRGLKKRGLKWIGLLIADGLAGLKKALRETFPKAGYQRCFLHKMRNVLDKLPDKCQEEAKELLREIYHASSKKTALEKKARFRERFATDYPAAAQSLEQAGEDLFSYFDFPRRHWKSIKSTNVIESMFNAVKLRTDAARRIKTRKSALFLVFKLLITQEGRLHKIAGYRLVRATIEQHKKPKRQLTARIAA